MAAEEAFFWGGKGRKRTQEQIDSERKVAAALMAKGGDFSPVGHWSQGLARVAQGLMGAIDDRRADAAENENATYNAEIIKSLLGGSSTPAGPTAASMPATTGAGDELSATSPAGGMDAYRNAIASIESKGSGDYAAIGPTNPKLGRALGRYQIMEANIGPWSQEALGRAVTPDEFLAGPKLQDAIFDKKFGGYVQQFGPEGAAQAWFAGPGGVGKTDRRDVLGTSVGGYTDKFRNALGPQVAAASPQAAIEAAAPASGYVDPMVSAPNAAQTALAPELPPPVEVGSAPAVAAAPQQQVAQALTAQPPQASSALNPAIIKVLTDPRAAPGTKAIAQILMQQEQAKAKVMQDQQTWMARQQYEQQQQRSDPLYQLKVQQAQNEVSGQGKAPTVVEIFDETTGQPYKATWNAKSGQYERIGGVKARSGMQLTTNPDGTVSLTEGSIGNMPKLTESEGRNSGFYGRGVESHQILNKLESEGTSLGNKVKGAIPLIGNFLRSEDAQKYDQARRNFINSVLRRESGAVISPEEFSNADQQYFPQPGDGPEVIEQKRRNRETTIQGLKISSGQGAAFATAPEAVPPEKKRLKYNPQTGELE